MRRGRRSKMKTVVILAVSLLGILTAVQGQNTNNQTVSSNDAVTLGMDMLLELENGMLLSFSMHYSIDNITLRKVILSMIIAMLPNPKYCLLLHAPRVHVIFNYGWHRGLCSHLVVNAGLASQF